MKLIPPTLEKLVHELSRLPGVGEKSALRFSLSLYRGGGERLESLKSALEELKTRIGTCNECFFWTDEGHCALCGDHHRSAQKLCVVRDSPDVLALERFKMHTWKYHVLQGFLSPLGGRGPSQIRIRELFQRMEREKTEELILAFDATIEGDATAFYVRDQLRDLHPNVRVTRMALGLPAGSSVEYLDPSTLESALSHRTTLE
jgi:recombination protein RecR